MTSASPYPISDNVYAGGATDPVEVELWSMELIGTLFVATPNGYYTVQSFLPEVIEEVKADVTGQYAVLKGSMGFSPGQAVPLFLSKDKTRLRDGIHRVALATILDWPCMTVSNTRIVYTSWDQSPEGIKYHELWEKRLRGLKNA